MSNTKKLMHPYGYAANSIIYNKSLSFSAKGVYLYILSKPDNWDFSYKRIASESTTSEYSVRKALQELEKEGLLKRLKLASGKVIYEIKDPVQETITQKTNTTSGLKSQKMNMQTADSLVAKTTTISNKDIKVIKTISNKEGEITLSENINQIAWEEWLTYRSTKKKVSSLAAKKQINFLAQFSPEEQQKIVNQSIQNDWQGLFPLRGNNSKKVYVG